MGFSKKMMGKEVGQAATYAPPHDMKGKGLTVNQLEKSRNQAVDPNSLPANKHDIKTPNGRVSMGDPNASNTKTSGIKIRGTGAATKGTMARGPMC
jgi:hypothetical protein